jgi:hypothetical protein
MEGWLQTKIEGDVRNTIMARTTTLLAKSSFEACGASLILSVEGNDKDDRVLPQRFSCADEGRRSMRMLLSKLCN